METSVQGVKWRYAIIIDLDVWGSILMENLVVKTPVRYVS